MLFPIGAIFAFKLVFCIHFNFIVTNFESSSFTGEYLKCDLYWIGKLAVRKFTHFYDEIDTITSSCLYALFEEREFRVNAWIHK